MKKIFFVLMMCILSTTTVVAGKIKRIDPTDWFVGMKNAKLQLMVYGESIGKAQVSTAWPGVRIDSVVRLDSPNYLLVYLDLSDAKAGNMPLVFTQGKQKSTINYRLREREMSGEQRRGFSNADVLYMLMPDRFASSGTKKHPMPGLNTYRVDRSQPSLRHGGDLEGIRQHLNYFTQLGVTALWFTPVLENNAADKGDYNMYHGYGTTDYYKVDPRFGTNAEYRRLVDESHTKGLKVVMDMIFNHCGVDHPWVKDMPARNWFNRPDYKNHYLQTSYKLTPVLDPYASEVDMDETVDGWFVPEYPDLNQRNPHVLRYLIQNSIWWIETVGIDGIRMDTYPYADREAMAKWMARINQEYPNFNTVGETWVTEPAYTAAWQEGSKLSTIDSHLKTVMDFAFFDRINRAKNEETDGWWNGLNRVYNGLCYDYLYPNPSSVMAFIEN
ncbi:MAG: alpha-amylase family glycosyl hydrolase, partial [Hoylesella saccharolytica]